MNIIRKFDIQKEFFLKQLEFFKKIKVIDHEFTQLSVQNKHFIIQKVFWLKQAKLYKNSSSEHYNYAKNILKSLTKKLKKTNTAKQQKTIYKYIKKIFYTNYVDITKVLIFRKYIKIPL